MSHPDEDFEEKYFPKDRKADKAERKRLSAKDRSKYKKTDQKKLERQSKEAPFPKENLLRGRVLSITPQEIVVDHEGETVNCVLRGLLKKEKTHLKNLVTVGDFVLFETTNENEGVIAHVEPRKSILSRADNLSRKKEQLIAANIDQVLITVSVMMPPLKPFLVDRYIIAARKGGMDPIVVLNKIDLLEDKTLSEETRTKEKVLYNSFLEAYAAVDIPVIPVSVITKEGLDPLRETMKGKASVFSGQSGVGKSSLINAITGLELSIGDVVEKTRKGAHTTTRAHLLRLDFGGWCIDTPGIKSFGLWDLKKEEIEQYYSEIQSWGEGCKYPNCTHIQEPGCVVVEAVEKGEISQVRYDSYLSLIEKINTEHLRR